MTLLCFRLIYGSTAACASAPDRRTGPDSRHPDCSTREVAHCRRPSGSAAAHRCPSSRAGPPWRYCAVAPCVTESYWPHY
uniref:Putative secreted peptide n=1 Tax=Anopheles braziliensis TaxID=58242 RepID=A0A2M3ZT66_9DIPT